MKRLGYAIFAFCVALAISPSQETAATQQGRLKTLMDDKLRYAKMLLEAVALNDFAKAEMSAEKLIAISKTAEWVVHETPRYELHSNEFRRAAESVIAKAKAKNSDGLAYGYVELSMTCFRCHQYVREVRDANFVDPSAESRILKTH